ncbi:tRNA(Ile)-lysidine synthase [Candidatus Ecksteinia adelgidicola]|nr:tRNA(Ile)-lysidine synthase [Candidatus Ecksteinia adelgidicola]
MYNNQLIKQVEYYLGNNKKLLVAFSGGLDSTVLLYLLLQLYQKNSTLQIRAIHIHHGLSNFSDTWVNHCRWQCAIWNISLIIQKVHVDVHIDGVEAAARKMRYKVFKNTLQNDEILVLAQHLDDQCETFLLALKRGSGPAGLSGMSICTNFKKNLILRPLMNFSRFQLQNYAKSNNLSWIEDDSNKNLRFDRNFLRIKILPLLTQRWPYFSSSVFRSAFLCYKQEKLLDELLNKELNALLTEDKALIIKKLLTRSLEHCFALLRRWITLHNVCLPSLKQLHCLWNEVIFSRIDAKPQLKLKFYQIRRFHGLLYLLPLMENLRNIQINWSQDTRVILPDKLGHIISGKGDIHLRAPSDKQKVSIRFGGHGIIRIIGRVHSRSIKKLWKEFKIPPWERDRIPLIYYDEQLIAALNVFICEEGKILNNKNVLQLFWDKNSYVKNK